MTDYQPRHRAEGGCRDATGVCVWCENFVAEMNACRGWTTPKHRADDVEHAA